MKRRDFLKKVLATTVLTSIPTIYLSRSANAIEPATITAVIAIATQVSKFFPNGPDPIAHELRIINLKLDTIIELQKQLLEGIAAVSEQLKNLDKELLTIFAIDRARQFSGSASGLHTNLSVILKSLKDRKTTFKEADEELEKIADRANKIAASMPGYLAAQEANNKRGVGLVLYSAMALKSLSALPYMMNNVDSLLRSNGVTPKTRQLRYKLIANSTALLADRIKALAK